MFSAIAKIYGNNVMNGRKSFEEVPEKISEEVREYILSEKPNFFDVPKEPIEEEVSEDTHADPVVTYTPADGEDALSGSSTDEPIDNGDSTSTKSNIEE